MSLLAAFADLGKGIARSMAIRQMRNDPKLRRRAAQRAGGCTPCAAAAYVADLNKAFGNDSTPKKKSKKR